MSTPTPQTYNEPIDLNQNVNNNEIPLDTEPVDTGKKENPFEKEKFDAGINVDEDADPKKYIEKLTGKLAQKLRDYNGGGTDIDLNKFVINSLIPAAIPEMGKSDAEDVIKKVKDNINNTPEQKESEPQSDGEEPIENIQQESKEKMNIDELISKLLNTNKQFSGNKKFKKPNFK